MMPFIPRGPKGKYTEHPSARWDLREQGHVLYLGHWFSASAVHEASTE